MKRYLPILALIGFLGYTGVYIFVYLFRSFRTVDPIEGRVVEIWHGDPFARAILVSVLFLIGLVILLYVSLTRTFAFRGGQVRFRPDLWEWIVRHGEETNEQPERVAERAVASYRARLEGVTER